MSEEIGLTYATKLSCANPRCVNFIQGRMMRSHEDAVLDAFHLADASGWIRAEGTQYCCQDCYDQDHRVSRPR